MGTSGLYWDSGPSTGSGFYSSENWLRIWIRIRYFEKLEIKPLRLDRCEHCKGCTETLDLQLDPDYILQKTGSNPLEYQIRIRYFLKTLCIITLVGQMWTLQGCTETLDLQPLQESRIYLVKQAESIYLVSQYRKSVLHLLRYRFVINLSRCSTDMR